MLRAMQPILFRVHAVTICSPVPERGNPEMFDRWNAFLRARYWGNLDASLSIKDSREMTGVVPNLPEVAGDRDTSLRDSELRA